MLKSVALADIEILIRIWFHFLHFHKRILDEFFTRKNVLAYYLL